MNKSTWAYGLANFWGADVNLRLAPNVQEHQGGPSRKILKNKVSLMPFPAFWSEFLGILKKQNLINISD